MPRLPILLAAVAAAPLALAEALPARLADTGLYDADGITLAPGVMTFTPQYSLWSDGARKRRYLYLPPGTPINGARPDAWEFPPGTKLWKEFSHGAAVETRLIERLGDGSWRYVAYAWSEDGREARLVGDAGLPGHPVASAPGGRYDIPSRDDCRACHEGTPVPVLGFSALQLSPDRDPNAAHAEPRRPGDLGLDSLVARGLLVNFPLAAPPRIPAATPTTRAALGYLHANCGHCHNAAGPIADLDLVLAQGVTTSPAAALATLAGRPSDFTLPGAELRLVAGHPEASVLFRRLRSRHPLAQMPPLGTRTIDDVAVRLVERWILEDLSPATEVSDD